MHNCTYIVNNIQRTQNHLDPKAWGAQLVLLINESVLTSEINYLTNIYNYTLQMNLYKVYYLIYKNAEYKLDFS